MPSPQAQNRYSNGSLLRSSTGAAVRRGDIKISDPIPHHQSQNIATRHNSDWPMKTTASNMQRGRHFSTGNLEPMGAGRASVGPSLIPSSISTGLSQSSIRQKKQSGFRATLRRMFGSKKGRPSMDDARQDYHRSDPGNLTAITERSTDINVARIPSRAGTGVTRTSALGSHGLNLDFTLESDVVDQAILPPTGHRRRNTLPSLVITEQMAPILARTNDQNLTSRSRAPETPVEGHLKRRSRSADALNRMISDITLRNAANRDRESDIAYWRKSIVENPPPNWPPWQEDQTESIAPSTRAEEVAPDTVPLQNFDFGLDRDQGHEVPLEDRVNTLEVKVFDFEFAIAKLQGHDIPKPMLQQKLPKRRSIHGLFPPEMDSGADSSSSSHEPTSFLTSPDDSPLPLDEPFRPDRSSKATIRPLTARRRSGAHSPSPVRITVDQFDRIMDIIRREQNSRRQLEAQVNELQQQLDALRSPVYAEIRETTDYPTPNSKQGTPATNKTLRRSPPFSSGKKSEQSRFSMSEIDSDTDGGFDEAFETPQDNKFMFEHPRNSPMIGVSP